MGLGLATSLEFKKFLCVRTDRTWKSACLETHGKICADPGAFLEQVSAKWLANNFHTYKDAVALDFCSSQMYFHFHVLTVVWARMFANETRLNEVKCILRVFCVIFAYYISGWTKKLAKKRIKNFKCKTFICTLIFFIVMPIYWNLVSMRNLWWFCFAMKHISD